MIDRGMVVHLYSRWASSWRLAAASSRWASSDALIGTLSLHNGHSSGWPSCWQQTKPLIGQLITMDLQDPYRQYRGRAAIRWAPQPAQLHLHRYNDFNLLSAGLPSLLPEMCRCLDVVLFIIAMIFHEE
eukprot:scaffold114194_cov18-Prasinocladus_malaysianus.AAC.1